MTHYLLFVGDNNSGKSNALRVFNHLGYRPLFDTSITTANIYNFLDRFEEGQGIILEDEIDDIEEQPEKMRICKVGYVLGAKITRMYGSYSPNKTKAKEQQRFNTFCFKAFSSERQPSFSKAKGFTERLFTIKCSRGCPQHDISEVTNEATAGDQEQVREINDLRKLLIIYRIIHYHDPIPDVNLSIKDRDRQLCKPVIRLFKNTKVIAEIVDSLSRFLYEKNSEKINSFDSYLYSVVAGLVKDNGNLISNETLWDTVCKIPGYHILNKPQSFQTEEFGQISKAQITKICEDKFGAHKDHDGKKRYLVFDKNRIGNLRGNYSVTKEIRILDDNNTPNTVLDNDYDNNNTPNTFNTFCNDIEDTIKDTSNNNDDKQTETDLQLKSTESEKNNVKPNHTQNSLMQFIKEGN